MTWFAYTDVKLTVLKNGSPYAKGNYKGFPLIASVVAQVQTDVNTSGGYLDGVTRAYRWASGSDNTWGFYLMGETETSDILKTRGITAALENVGDELTFYNEETGPRYALHIKRVSSSGVRSFQATYTFDGTKLAYGGINYAYDGVDSYGRERRACIGFCKQDYGVYPFVILAVDKGESAGTLAEVHPWRAMSRADFVNTNQYKYYLVVSDSWTPPPNDDPFHDGGSSTDQLQTGDATGDFDDSSDLISIPGAPSLNLASNYFIKVWQPTLTDLDDLADIMYGNFDKTDPQQWLSQIFADPRDGIVALFMLPFTPATSTKIAATVGRHVLIKSDSTNLEMAPITGQFHEVDCGSITFSEYYGNYLDYNPYTRITLFLPFVGEVQLDPDEVMGETVSVKYHVDVYSGSFVAFVATATKVLAQYQGYCALQMCYTSADYSRLNQAVIGAATAAVGIASGVAVGGAAIGSAAGMSIYGQQGAGQALASGVEAFAGSAQGAASTALNVQSSKVNHSHSGALGGAAGFMGNQKPYVIIHRARQSVPLNANAYKGYPCNATFTLSDLEGAGFTKISDIVLDNMGGYSDAEIAELRSILAAGVFL